MTEDFRPFTRRAWREFWNAVARADIVLEVVDARDPPAFRIKEIEKRLSEMGKRVIIVINKADLVPKNILEKWKKVFEKRYPTIFVSSRHRLGTGKLRKMILRIADKEKDIINVAVVGYPNVGKSSLINILKGAHSAPTGAKPGLTRKIQELRRGRIRILDTPGVFPYENAEALVYKGAVRVETLEDPVHHATDLIKKLKKIDESILIKTYGFDNDDPLAFLEQLAIRRGRLLKGGRPNIDEAARIVLRDWQIGKIVIWKDPTHYDEEDGE